MSDLLLEIAGAGAGELFLIIFFRAVQSGWPESYFSVTDITSYKISVTPTRSFFSDSDRSR